MQLQLLTVVLAALVVGTIAFPQQPAPQQQRPQQPAPQQQQRPQQPAPQQQRPQPQQQQAASAGGKPGAAAGKPGSVPLHLDPNLTLTKISKKDLDRFLASKEAVNELVNCFEDLRKCKARAGVSLVRDVRSLGRGGRCKKCSPEEQAHTRQLVGSAISGLQQKHPTEWRRLLPEIGFLL